MTGAIDHDRCSELLPAFLDGEVPQDVAGAIEVHLASCDECATERRGLEALRGDLSERLTTAERAALERGVMSGIAQDTNEDSVVPLAPRRRAGIRLAGALGAAATVAVLASLVYFGTTGGVDQAGTEPDSATGEEQSAEALQDGSRRRNGKTGRADRLDTAAADSQPGGGSAAAAGTGAKGPAPTFRVENAPLTGADLQKRGESSLESVSFAASYSANDAGNRTLLEQLVESARARAGDDVAAQVEDCAEQVLETSDPTIPTFGSVGELDGQEVLVLGFAWTRRSSGPLDRYMVWAWERGSCDVAVDFVEGRIETAN